MRPAAKAAGVAWPRATSCAPEINCERPRRVPLERTSRAVPPEPRWLSPRCFALDRSARRRRHTPPADRLLSRAVLATDTTL